jgi:hypothetical protein
MALTTQVYRKPTHTGRYLNFNSNHLPQVKRGIIYNLLDRASTICQDKQEQFLEINTLKRDLQLTGYSKGFINSVIRSKDRRHQKEGDKLLGMIYIPYVKGVSEKLRHIGKQYNIRTVFGIKHTLRFCL